MSQPKPMHLLVLGATLLGSAPPGPRVEIGEVHCVERGRGAEARTRGRPAHAALELGRSVRAPYASRGDAAWLFAGAADARVVLEAVAHDATDPELAVYGPRGERGFAQAPLVAHNDDRRRGTLDARAELALPRDGTYLVVVREHAGRRGAFTLSLHCAGMSAPQDGNCEPIALSLGQLSLE